MRTLKTLFSALLSIMLITSCSSKEEKTVEKVDDKPIVKLALVNEENVPQISEYTATVEAYKVNNITTSTMNRIKKILVDVGSNVRAGQTVVILDDVNIEQMRLRLANKKLDYERAKELFEIGGGTKQSVDQFQTEYEAYKRSYENVLENTMLASPISGVVTARNYDNGDMTGQTPILTIENIQPVKILVNISEQDFTRIYKGQKVIVKLDVYGEEEFEGQVSLIHPTVDPKTRTFKVEINIPNAKTRIRPGMFARVTVNFGSKNNVVVPDLAIVKQPGSGNKYVYVYNDGKVSFNRVELGQRMDNKYELISGVENNSYVVISGQTALSNGIEVKVANPEILKSVTESNKQEEKK